MITINFIGFIGLICLGFLFEFLKGINYLLPFKLHDEKHKVSLKSTTLAHFRIFRAAVSAGLPS